MKLIKFLFWIVATIIVAYFMTDIRIGERTLKENIDHYVRFGSGMTLKEKVNQLVREKAKIPPEADNLKGGDEISKQDEESLKKVIEKRSP